ncbi:hypothetical protein Avbf_06405, partial [Armadillidium vulgare]
FSCLKYSCGLISDVLTVIMLSKKRKYEEKNPGFNKEWEDRFIFVERNGKPMLYFCLFQSNQGKIQKASFSIFILCHLKWIITVRSSQNASHKVYRNLLPSTSQLHKLQQQIIEERILNYQYQDPSSGVKSISPIEELVIVRCIAQYLANIFDPATRNSLFITLFPAVSNEPQTLPQLRTLMSLVSLAVATHNVAVLDATAVWMQQVSCFSVRCCKLSFNLNQDFFQSNIETPEHFMKALKSLPTATPLFCANLITSLAQVICAEHIKNIADVLVQRFNSCKKFSPGTNARETSLNRLAQIVLVALHTKLFIRKTFRNVEFFKEITRNSKVNEDAF